MAEIEISMASKHEQMKQGQKFGRLTFLRSTETKSVGKRKKKMLFGEFVCDCGGKRTTALVYVSRGKTQSCGCIISENSTVHGKSRERLHKIWYDMLRRCNNPKDGGYQFYGAKGVEVCAGWDDYNAFEKWALANGYEASLTLDRIDPAGYYCPENCRWADKETQARNKRNKLDWIVNGVKYDAAIDAAKAYDVSITTIGRWCGQIPYPPNRVYKTKPNCYVELLGGSA